MKKLIKLTLIGAVLAALSLAYATREIPHGKVWGSYLSALAKDLRGEEVTCADFVPEIRQRMPSCASESE